MKASWKTDGNAASRSAMTDRSLAPVTVKPLAAMTAVIMIVAACGTSKKAATFVEEFRMPVPTQVQADSILCALDADAEPGRFLSFVFIEEAPATSTSAATGTAAPAISTSAATGTATPATSTSAATGTAAPATSASTATPTSATPAAPSTTVPAATPAGDPIIYGIIPHRDSAQIKIVTITPDKKTWAVKESWSRPIATDEGLRFSHFVDTAKVVTLNSIPHLTFTEERTDGNRLQRTVSVYTPSTLQHNGVSFSGRAVKDGKFKGTSDKNIRNGAERAQLAWAVQKLESFPDLIFQTEADIMSDQAIEWWLSKNPDAQTGAKRISIGQIPAESTLATAFEAAKKVKGSKYYAATFDMDDYTVIVSKNRSTGQYSLAWVEPVCKNKKTDRYITTMYFNQDTSNLVMHYYKGNKTFSYWLNLANGILQK